MGASGDWEPLPVRTRLIIVGIVVALVVGWWAWNRPPSGAGDPGGRLLAQLHALDAVVPPGSAPFDRMSQEPSWVGSCTEEYFTRGWTPGTYYFSFRSERPESQVLAFVLPHMRRLGWHLQPYTTVAGTWMWSRHLVGGERATAQLGQPSVTPGWTVAATANPVGPLGRCAGG